MLLKLSGDHYLAQDLTQNTFIRAYSKIKQYKLGKSFRAWLGGIAYREFLQSARTIKSETKKLEAFAENNFLIEQRPLEDSLIDLDRGLMELSRYEKTAFLLNYAVGMTHDEIAIELNKPLGTIKSWVNRSRIKLLKILDA